VLSIIISLIRFILRVFGVQNLFCVFLECKIYFACFWSAKFILRVFGMHVILRVFGMHVILRVFFRSSVILRGLDNSDLMTMLSIISENQAIISVLDRL